MIFFFTDQQRWDTIGLHGNPLDLTPNLDRAAESRDAPLQLLYAPTPVWSRALVPADGALRDHDRLLQKRYPPAAGGNDAGPPFPRGRLRHRVHRQVAPGRRRTGA